MALLIPLGLSGIVLAWDDTIDPMLSPARYAVTGGKPLDVNELAAAAAAVTPGAQLAMLRLPSDRPAVATLVQPKARRASGQGQRFLIWLDPATGRTLDQARNDEGLIAFAHRFHGSLFVPGAGRALVGVLGTAMFLLALSGLWLWWPQAGPWSRALRWRRGDKRTDTNLHHLVGFWIALPLGIQAFTGAAMAWPQMMAMVGLAPAHANGGPGRAAPLAQVRLQPDQAITAARRIMSGSPRLISWPTEKDEHWRVVLAESERTSDFEIDDATGSARRASFKSGGFPRIARGFHQGDTLGLVWRLALIPIGLSPMLLGITGLLMWLRGRGRRVRSADRARVRVPEPA